MITTIFQELLSHLSTIAYDTAIGLLPLVGIFLLFQFTLLKLPKRKIIDMIIGMVYAYVGLVLFFLGLEIGFNDTGLYLGKTIGAFTYNWILIPLGLLIGFSVVLAEPAVHSLVRQIETVSDGMIQKKAVFASLCIGVALAVALAMFRAIYNISYWYFLIPGYLLALILTKFSPPIFTAIAFDSGGVASGAMTSTFILSFAIGVTSVTNPTSNIGDSFGVVGLIAMTPLITLQVLGLIYERKTKLAELALQNTDTEENIGLLLDEDDFDGLYHLNDETPEDVNIDSRVAIEPEALAKTSSITLKKEDDSIHENEPPSTMDLTENNASNPPNDDLSNHVTLTESDAVDQDVHGQEKKAGDESLDVKAESEKLDASNDRNPLKTDRPCDEAIPGNDEAESTLIQKEKNLIDNSENAVMINDKSLGKKEDLSDV